MLPLWPAEGVQAGPNNEPNNPPQAGGGWNGGNDVANNNTQGAFNSFEQGNVAPSMTNNGQSFNAANVGAGRFGTGNSFPMQDLMADTMALIASPLLLWMPSLTATTQRPRRL